MSDTYKILFLGDVVGEPGRNIVREELPKLKVMHEPLFIVVNGENSAGGLGITPKIADQLFEWGADVITLGNHAFNKREIEPYLETSQRIVRPINMPIGVPGRGLTYIVKEDIRLGVLNLCGRVYMDSYGDPFESIDQVVGQLDTPHFFVDFHGEATSEKIAMGWHCAGRATAVVGTHTHVTTADETVLPGGTAYITDVGMCGPRHSVLGMNREVILKRFRTTLPQRFEVANEPGVLCGVVIEANRSTGRATAIRRIKSETEA